MTVKKTSLFIIALFVLSACRPGLTEDQKRSQEITEAALQMIRYNELPENGEPLWRYVTAELEEAIALDSSNALTYASLALPYMSLPSTGDMTQEESRAKSRGAAVKALELDPDLADAHIADAITLHVFENDAEGAGQALRKALELDPDHTEARREMSIWYSRTGDLEKSLEEMDKAIALEDRPQLHVGRCNTLMFLGRAEEAMEAGMKAFEADPVRGLVCLSPLYAAKGDFETLLGMVDQGLAREADNQNLKYAKAAALAQLGQTNESVTLYEELGNLGGKMFALAHGGQAEEARAMIPEFSEQIEQGQWWWNIWIAQTHLALGDYEKAIKSIESVHNEFSDLPINARRELQWWLRDVKASEEIRNDPRIQSIINTEI